MRFRLLVALAVSMSLGCQMPLPTASGDGKSRVSSRKAPAIKKDAAPGQVGAGSPAIEGPTRAIAQTGAATQLIGKVKLLSDKGAGIISNNTGNLVSNNGGGLVSDKGAGYRVAAAAEENLLAEATIHVLDAEGHVLVDEAGEPLTATTDAQGNYKLSAVLPAENLVLRVPLFPNAEADRGHLLAFLPKPAASGEQRLEINTATSLGASYVLDKYVQSRQAVLDKLPASEAAALAAELEAARALLDAGAISYKREDLVSATEGLRAKAPKVDAALERIRAILLAGQQNLGAGLRATQVPLALPLAVTMDASGNLLIGEASASRIRKVSPDGRISLYAGVGASIGGNSATNFGGINNMAFGLDGSLYVSESLSNRVQRITPDGRLVPVAGDTLRKQGALGGAATATSLIIPGGLAVAADSTVYIGEMPTEVSTAGMRGRLLKVGTDGIISEVPCPEADWAQAELTGVAVAADGTLWVMNSTSNQIARQRPGGAWEFPVTGISIGSYSRMLLASDGTLYFSSSVGNRVYKVPPGASAPQIIAGTGETGFAGDGGPATGAQLSDPAGLHLAPDGTLYVADAGNGLIRAIAPDGTIRTVAGAQGVTQVGDALTLGVNQPGGMTLDPQGRLVFGEVASSQIKRLENGRITAVAGTTKGSAGDGGPATAAQFNFIGGLAYVGETLYVADRGRLRRIGPDGVITTVAGDASGAWNGVRLQPGSEASLERVTGVAAAPDGRVYFSDLDLNMVLRLNLDGQVEVVAGTLDGSDGAAGDGGPASAAKLSKPSGLVFDQAGNLYIADSGNFRIRKVDTQGNISTYAGLPTMTAVAKLFGPRQEEGIAATEAVIVAPCSMAFDAAGNLFVGEVGTFGLNAIQGGGATPIAQLPDTPALIRKITPEGKIYTIAGKGARYLAEPENDNGLLIPIGLAIDPEGRLVIADSGTNQIKLLPKSAL